MLKRRLSKPKALLPGPDGQTLVAVGRFGRAHGVMGEVRIDSTGGLPRGLKGYSRFFLFEAGELRPLAVRSWRLSGDDLLVLAEGYADRDKCRELTGCVLYVPRDELPPLAPDEYYHCDLIDREVVGENGEPMGTVADVKSWGDYDMLFVVQGKKTRMIPVLSEFVLDLGEGGGPIRARQIEGL